MKISRRKSNLVKVGNISIGNDSPIVVQSMTDTDTSDVVKTVNQIKELRDAGSEIVRITVNNDRAAKCVEIIKNNLKKLNINWAKVDIDPTKRPEELTLESFIKLSEEMKNL